MATASLNTGGESGIPLDRPGMGSRGQRAEARTRLAGTRPSWPADGSHWPVSVNEKPWFGLGRMWASLRGTARVWLCV